MQAPDPENSCTNRPQYSTLAGARAIITRLSCSTFRMQNRRDYGKIKALLRKDRQRVSSEFYTPHFNRKVVFMRKHRTVQFIATLIFLAALFYLAFGVISAVLIGRAELGAGWGPGWHGWAALPVLFSSLCGGLVLLTFGAVLFFLARIDNNLSLARRGRVETAPSAPSKIEAVGAAAAAAAPSIVAEAAQPGAPLIEAEVEAPPVLPDSAQLVGALTAPQLESPKVALPKLEAALPDIELPKVELPEVELPKVDLTAPGIAAALPDIELPKVELPKVELTAPSIAAALPDIALPKVELPEVELPKIAAALPDIALPKVDLPEVVAPQAPTDDVAALRAQLAALQARLASLEAPAPAASSTATAGVSEEILAGAEARLPGSDEVARIAAEMAVLRPPKNRPTVTLQPLASLTPAPVTEDDLEVIQGIGPAYAQRLRALGITTFAALAEASEEVLNQVAGRFADRVRSEDWRGQAQRLMKRS